ncbi:DUF7344 domain-containing protein [Halovivax limisalsi]|uniref:DUF7344 domain-containing protein n=1 Tax=Halovivax limisalsi TaxID=1453760 RepID=UPI001FFDB440|nr:transcriptional regulator [Halovivax limisalsi]
MNDRTFDALTHTERRRLLLELLDHNPRELTYTSDEATGSGTQQAAVEREPARIRTHHVHLPKLAEYGYVEWDREADVVTKGPQFDEVRPLLEFLRDECE